MPHEKGLHLRTTFSYNYAMEDHSRQERLQQKIDAYRPSAERLAYVSDTHLLFLVGISGAGKDTITHELLAQHADYYRMVTHTTRAPRKNHGVLEQEGVEYHFVDLATAEHMLDEHDYVEANMYGGNVYGTSIREIQKAHDEHKIIIGDIDVNGVASFMKLGLNVRPVFVLPPSYAVWQERLLRRYEHGIDEADWRKRMETARHEIEHALDTDYFYLVVNDDLQTTTGHINHIARQGELDEHRPAAALAAAQEILAGINDALER